MAVDRFLVANLLHINGLDEFSPFRKWLQDQLDNWRDQCVTQKDAEYLRQAQGRAQAYKEILDLLAKAPALADKQRG